MIFKNMAVCDLRGYNTAQAAGEIKEIWNSAVVILPKNMNEAAKSAFAAIKMKNVAATMYADDDTKINTFNGDVTLNSSNISGDSIWVINGTAVIMPLPEGSHVSIIVNGTVYNDISNKNTVEFLSVNGSVKNIDIKSSIILPDRTETTDDMLFDEQKYFVSGEAIIKKVSEKANGSVEANKIYAHESVKQSKIHLIAEDIVYYSGDGGIVFSKNMNELHISQNLLLQVDGMMIIKNVKKLIFENDVEPQTFKEKVLEIKNVDKLTAPEKIFDILQLRVKNIGKIKRKR